MKKRFLSIILALCLTVSMACVGIVPAAADADDPTVETYAQDTVDGSVGIKGFVTDALSRIACPYYYCCGPLPMLKAVHRAAASAGQLSFEERMGCGFGACMGCTCQTKNGNKRICKEGPVLRSEEVLW